MSRFISVRRCVGEAYRFVPAAWRATPLGVGLIALALLVPTLLGGREVGLATAIAIPAAQLAAALAGWTALLRAAGGGTDVRLGADEARVLASGLLCALFMALIALILGLVVLGSAGATGLAEGDDLRMAAQTSLTQGGWKGFVILALQIASALILLTLWARLLPAGPATLAAGRVVSLALLGRTRGSGLRPAGGLVLVLAPLIVLILGGLILGDPGAPAEDAWIDWLWAGVLSMVQWPLMAGYANALWRALEAQGDAA